MKRPAFMFYPNDWMKDPGLRVSSLAARGLWADLMAIMHDGVPYGHLTVNNHPLTIPDVARLVGASMKETSKLLVELERNGVPSRTPEGVLFSRRMIRDEHIRNVRAEAGKIGGKAPSNPPANPKQKAEQTKKQKTPPLVAVAVASSLAAKQGEEDLQGGEPRPHSRVDNPVNSGNAGEQLSPTVTRFMAHFYGQSSPERRAEVARQMTGAMLTIGVQYQGTLVRAVDVAHLDDACQEVLESPPRESNAAWMFVLLKLRDSYSDVFAQRQKAWESAPIYLKILPPTGPTPIGSQLAGVLADLKASSEDSE